MQPEDFRFIECILRRTTLKDCLEWFRQTRDKEVSAALRPLVIDKDTGAFRVVSNETLRGELLALARKNSAFRRFVADKSAAELDRITAQYLEEQLGET